MAAPDLTPPVVAQIVHDNSPGYSQAGWTLVSKVLQYDVDGLTLWSAVGSKGPATWTFTYITQSDGTVGKVCGAVDDNGRWWSSRGGGTTWL